MRWRPHCAVAAQRRGRARPRSRAPTTPTAARLDAGRSPTILPARAAAASAAGSGIGGGGGYANELPYAYRWRNSPLRFGRVSDCTQADVEHVGVACRPIAPDLHVTFEGRGPCRVPLPPWRWRVPVVQPTDEVRHRLLAAIATRVDLRGQIQVACHPNRGVRRQEHVIHPGGRWALQEEASRRHDRRQTTQKQVGEEVALLAIDQRTRQVQVAG